MERERTTEDRTQFTQVCCHDRFNSSIIVLLHQPSFSSTCFVQIFVRTSFFYVHLNREKLLKQFLYEKCVQKMLMKLTPGEIDTRCQFHQRSTSSFFEIRSQKCKKDWEHDCLLGAFRICSLKSCSLKVDEIDPRLHFDTIIINSNYQVSIIMHSFKITSIWSK